RDRTRPPHRAGGKAPLSLQLLSGSGRRGEESPLDLRLRRDAEVQVLPLPALRHARGRADHRVLAGRPRRASSVRHRARSRSRQGTGDEQGTRPPSDRHRDDRVVDELVALGLPEHCAASYLDFYDAEIVRGNITILATSILAKRPTT